MPLCSMRCATTGHELVELSMEQLGAFAGNMLELRSARGGSVVAMSRTSARLAVGRSSAQPSNGSADRSSPRAIPTIETLGGGSVRCMLAEIHLPKKL